METKVEKLILKENKLLRTLHGTENIYKSNDKLEHHFVSFKIINKLVTIQSKLLSQPNNLLLTYASLRYIFETLVHSKLLLKEPQHIYRIYYSVYEHQVGKTRRFIQRLKREIKLIGNYVNLENDILEKIKIAIKKDGKDIKVTLDKLKENESKIDKKAERELTIFFGDYKHNGFPFQKYLMENKLLPMYEQRLVELESLKEKKKKEIIEHTAMSLHFNYKKQTSKVFKELKDNRNWKAKAKEVKLEQEYSQIFELCSALLHSNSYSLITPSEPEKEENEFALDLILKYSYEIISNIEIFLDLNSINIKNGGS